MNEEFPKRKTTRLKNYDYSSNGCYFVTICTKDKKHLLSHYTNKDRVGAGFHARPSELIVKTPLGYDVERTIFYIAEHKNITVDNYIIMPNHVHLLITLDSNDFPIAGGRGNPQEKENLNAGGRGNPQEKENLNAGGRGNPQEKENLNTGGRGNPQEKENLNTGGRGNPPLQDIIGQLKSYTTRLYRERLNDKYVILWQRSFYDRIIRNETEFQNAWEYIEYNALKEYPKKIKEEIGNV